MSDAPKRIWAYSDGLWIEAWDAPPSGAEYIRADLLAELMEAATEVIPAALHFGGLTNKHLAAIERLETALATVSKTHQIKEQTK